jgi:hypothetical protein
MPEEPDLTPEDVEILDRNIRQRIEARKQLRQREAEEINSVADQILAALRSRPDGMRWPEIRGLFDTTYSDKQIEQALLGLMKTPLTRQKVEKKGEQSGERFLLAAS